MRLKFTYIEAAPVSSPYGGLQEDVRQFFQSVKSRAKTTAEEGDALLERALPHLASYSHLDPLNAEDLRNSRARATRMDSPFRLARRSTIPCTSTSSAT